MSSVNKVALFKTALFQDEQIDLLIFCTTLAGLSKNS